MCLQWFEFAAGQWATTACVTKDNLYAVHEAWAQIFYSCSWVGSPTILSLLKDVQNNAASDLPSRSFNVSQGALWDFLACTHVPSIEKVTEHSIQNPTRITKTSKLRIDPDPSLVDYSSPHWFTLCVRYIHMCNMPLWKYLVLSTVNVFSPDSEPPPRQHRHLASGSAIC